MEVRRRGTGGGRGDGEPSLEPRWRRRDRAAADAGRDCAPVAVAERSRGLGSSSSPAVVMALFPQLCRVALEFRFGRRQMLIVVLPLPFAHGQ